MTKTKIYTACKETGDLIEEVYTLREGLDVITQYEEEDTLSGLYEPDFYDIVNEHHESILL